MAQRTFNKNNWTGEDATITFNKNGTFTLNGDNFVIIRTTEKSDDFENQVSKVYRANPADLEFPGELCPVATANKFSWADGSFANDDIWDAFDGDDQIYCGILRTDKCDEIALAQVLFNII